MAGWYQKQLSKAFLKLEHEAYRLPYDPHYYVANLFEDPLPPELVDSQYELDLLHTWALAFGRLHLEIEDGRLHVLKLNRQQIPVGTYPSIQCNAAFTKDPSRRVPKPLVIVVHINGHPARALVDSGSLGNFISSTLVQQLNIEKKELTSPVSHPRFLILHQLWHHCTISVLVYCRRPLF